MEPIQLIATTGAAGVLFYVLKWVVDGKLHNNSEVDGLRQDKKDLLRINASLSEALRSTNAQLEHRISRTQRHSDVAPE